MPEIKVFLDTHIIIYAYDVSAKEKHEQARNILVDLWDSLIIQAAIKAGASLLLSEDLSGEHIIHGVTIKNPFKSPLPRFSER